MISIDDIRGRSAFDLLKDYVGVNPYLLKLKQELIKNNKLKLTENQTKYVIDNHDKEPIFINRVVRITNFVGQELKRTEELDFIPEKVLIEFILAETQKTFHIYGKFTKKQKQSKMFWLPKTQVIDDPYFEDINIDVDFDKYNNILSNYGKKLYKHQETGIKFLLSRNGCILADDMGLGKTNQTIIAALETGLEKILVVCPTSAKINWQREINVFCKDTTIIDGKKFKTAKFTIINFDILKNFHTLVDGRKINTYEGEIIRDLANTNFDLIIIDEAHNVKNPNSIRGKILLELATKYNVKKTWLLTGTPVANRPMDFFNLLKIIKSPIADNWQHYALRYCDAKKMFKTLKNGTRKKILITDGASNLEELSQRTKNYILRRLKEDTLDMPEKIITPMYYQLDVQSAYEYKQLWDEYISKKELQGKKEVNLQKELVELILLRKFIAEKAIPYTIEIVENAIEMDKKVIVFTSFNDEQNILIEHFGKLAVCHNGSMTTKEKQNSVDSFQNNPKVKVFIGNIKSAGVAITLTEATVVVFNSFDWVPGNNEQAEDRCVFGDQWVMTDSGYKMIQEININDKVYTHKGNFKKVIDKTSKLERKKLRYDINSFGFNKNLSVTHDHKLYIYDKEKNECYWAEAKDLNILNHYLTIKSQEQPINRLDEIEIPKFKSEYFKNNYNITQKNGRLVKLPETIHLSNDLLYAFGFYIADGWCVISDKKSDTINVCQKITNSKMYDASEYIINIIKKAFNIEKHTSYVDKNNVKSCTIHSSEMAHLFKMWFGKNVYTKQLPYWTDYLNKEQLKYLLDGYYHGDGYQRRKTQQATTASLKLISQLIRYNANLGRTISLSNNGENNYSIEYSLDGVENKRMLNVDGYIAFPIKSITISKPKRGEERVYDLSVEDDHSFVVGNYNVHNCFRLGQKNNVNIYYQLFDDTISIKMWDILKNKKEIISTIISDGKKTDDEITKIIIDDIMNKNI
jgi:SWI/SNF-related matrix-associated actin-dependent regulator 1 of chromatin subfamily A